MKLHARALDRRVRQRHLLSTEPAFNFEADRETDDRSDDLQDAQRLVREQPREELIGDVGAVTRSFEEALELGQIGGVLRVMPLEFEHTRLTRRAGSSGLPQPNTPKQIGPDRS